MWRKFLTPGWFFLLLFVVLFSYFSFTFFAPWQLGKNERIIERNHQIEQAFSSDPVDVSSVVPFEESDQWTRVSLTGHFVPDDEVVLRLRPVGGSPAFQALTPFQVNGGPLVLVNRGFVPAAPGDELPDIAPAPTNEVTTVGMVQLDERPSDREPLLSQGNPQVYAINSEQIGQLTSTDLEGGYVQLNADQPGVLNPIPIPQLERGNHLSYGLQWLAFGFLAPAGLLYFVFNEFRERRRVREEEEQLDAQGVEPVEEPSQEPVVHRSRSVRDRYGDAKPDYYAKRIKRERER
ncbi:SURF1 family protein [Corynebacterium tapiri]|uniref:SURF1-like protein n=2 Tax=Corynebacterium tapiri TaxID=1448266 RepID=A0A5C4U4R8_9CORY|nr:SURF1 family cytochrome oxidase biogenesis protein [Corynebacterium tapiri]TNL98785.1 SURF1 family protein [Corynebacterium tapiri]